MLVCVLAALPPLWVVKTRWFDPIPGNRLIRSMYGWCSWQLLCQSHIPVIVLFGFLVCAASIIVVLAIQRKSRTVALAAAESPPAAAEETPPRRRKILARILFGVSGVGFLLTAADSLISGRIPGWNLIAVYACGLAGFLLGERVRIADGWKRNAGFWLAILLNHMLFLASLRAVAGRSAWGIPAAAAFLISLAALWPHRRRLSPAYFLFLTAILLFTLGNDTWWSSLVGDEYSQFILNSSVARERDWVWFGGNLFNTEGNFGTTPLVATYIQVFFMKIFGLDGFGWRFSNAYLCAAGIALLYGFLRKFLAERIALTAAALLAGSAYLIGFAKIGYTNLQAFFALALVLFLSAEAARSKSRTAFFLLGSALAFCGYTFPAALYVLPLPFLFLGFHHPPKTRGAAADWGILLAAFATLAFPLFLQPDYWAEKIPGTVLANPNALQTLWRTVDHFLANGLYAFFSFLYVQQETHFIAVSYADPITGALILIGFGVWAANFRRSRFCSFWMASFFCLLFLVGMSHGYDVPPTTRMFLMLPCWMVFAASGLEYLLEGLTALFRLPPKVLLGVRGAILLFIVGVNLYQAQVLAYDLYASRPPLESIFLRSAEEATRIRPGSFRRYLFLTDSSWTAAGLRILQSVYPQVLGGAEISDYRVDGGPMPKPVLESLADPATMVFLLPFSHAGWQEDVEKILREAGKDPCRIRTAEGKEVVAIFAPPEFSPICHPRWGFPPGLSCSFFKVADCLPMRRPIGALFLSGWKSAGTSPGGREGMHRLRLYPAIPDLEKHFPFDRIPLRIHFAIWKKTAA